MSMTSRTEDEGQSNQDASPWSSVFSFSQLAHVTGRVYGSATSTIGSLLVKPEPILHLRPTWNTTFATAVKLLKIGSSNIPRNIHAIRLVTDNGVPSWIPTLPSGVACVKSTHPPGEWFYPKSTGPRIRVNGNSAVIKEGQYILYFHGGAFCCCNSATHRGLLIRLVHQTNATLLSVDYRRPPEHPYPTPVDDCLSAYMYILERVGDSSRIILAGDSAGGKRFES